MRGSSRWRVSAFLLTFSTRRKNLTRSLRVEMPDEELKEDCTPEVTCTSGTQVKYKVTFAEGDEDLFLLNRLNGKKYKFNLTEME